MNRDVEILARAMSDRVCDLRLERAKMPPNEGISWDDLPDLDREPWLDAAEAAMGILGDGSSALMFKEHAVERVAALIERLVGECLPADRVYGLVSLAEKWEVHPTYPISVWAREQAKRMLGLDE